MTPREQEGNKTRSKIRSRIEHIFGVQAQRAGNLLLRTIGIARARAKIGLRNLVYNLVPDRDASGDKQVKCVQEAAKWQKKAIERRAGLSQGVKLIGLKARRA